MDDPRSRSRVSERRSLDEEEQGDDIRSTVEAVSKGANAEIRSASATPDQRSIHLEQREDVKGQHPDQTQTQAQAQAQALILQNKVEGSRIPSRTAWKPFWLHWYILLLLGLICACSVAAIVVLYYFSEKNQGLITTSNTRKYAWKYGPTAFLTILAAFWQQIDYLCRSLEPWRNLARGHSAETETLLLDYVSAGLPYVIFRALKKKHWAVAASSTGSLALLVAITFSTGLLGLSSIPFRETDVEIPLTTKFSGENYEASFLQTAPRSWYGTNILGIPYEPGVRPDNAYQILNLTADWLRNSTVTAEVEAFVPSYNCEAVELEDVQIYKKPQVSFFGINITEGWIKYNVRSKDCLVQQEYRLLPDPSGSKVPQRLLKADITNINESCAASSNREGSPDGLLTDSTVRLITLLDIRYQQLIEPTLNETALGGAYFNVTGWSGSVAAMSSIICRPTYSIFSATVQVATSLGTQDILSVQLKDEKADHIPTFSYRNLSYAFESPLLVLLQSTLPPLPTIQGTNQSIIGSFWQLMSLANGGSTLEPFLDTSLTLNTANRMFQGVMSEFANQQLSVPNNSTTTGTRTFFKDRLQMKLVSSLVVGIMLVFLVIFLGMISIFKAADVVPRDPASIATIATLLTNNVWAGEFLKGQGHASDVHLKYLMYGRSYQSSTDNTGAIISTSTPAASEQTRLICDKNLAPWRPFPLSPWFMIPTSMYLCGLIAAISVLRQLSDRPQGICSVSVSSTWASELSTVVPAAVMVLGAKACSSAYETIATFVPYSKLHHGGVTAPRSLMMRTTGRLHVINMVTGARTRSSSLVLSSIAVIIASFLSTIVAALYQIEPYGSAQTVSAYLVDQFNFGYTTDRGIELYASDNATGLVLSLVDQQNASFPPFVYDELVFPKFVLPSTSLSNGSSIVVDLPATRASLRCDFVPQSALSISYFSPNRGQTEYGAVVNASFTLPDSCGWQGLYPIPHEQVMYLRNEYEESYGSSQIDMLYDWITNERETNSTCYSIGFVFGAFQYNHTYNENITMMSCYQDIEMVNTTTTFLPSMLIDRSNPPIVHEESRQTIRPNVLYQLSALLDTNLLDFNLAGVDDAPGTSGSYTFHDVPMSPFYQAVIHGPDGIPASEIVGERNQDRLYNATLHMYRRYMALLIHNNMREPLASIPAPQEATTPVSYSGKVITSTALRVVQDPQSALILQIMLAVVLVLMTLAYLLTTMRNVLRHSPCTIAGVMSLLAGSDLCTRAVIPEGAEYMTDKELEEVFGGYQFSLGWFSGGEEAQGQARNERFGIDIGKAQRSR